MNIEAAGSVTRWIDALREGEADEAVRAIWARYFERLTRLARARLGSSPRAMSDEEDVAIITLEAVCRGIAANRFPGVGNRDELWRLLATVVGRRVANQVRDGLREKRGGGRVFDEAASLAEIAEDRPAPDYAASVLEESLRMLGMLADPSHRAVALMKLEGYTNVEVAARLDCGVRSVDRKLALIRKAWRLELEEER